MRPLIFIVLLLSMILSIVSCKLTGTKTANGSGSDAEATIVAGTVIDTNGSEVGNVSVKLREKGFLSNSGADSGAASNKRILRDTVTDNEGAFYFLNIVPNNYIIEANFRDSLGVKLDVEVKAGEEKKELPPDTLFPLATLSGNVPVILGAPSNIRVYGMERDVNADSLGNFNMRLPKGNYLLSITDRSTMEKRDTGISVQRGRHVQLEPIIIHESCRDYACDSTVMRGILDSNGLSSLSVEEVSKKEDGRIKEVRLRNRGLDHFPMAFLLLGQIEFLTLGRNEIELLPLGVNKFPNLKILVLDNNKLRSVIQGLGQLSPMKHLDLSHNEITQLPEDIVNLTVKDLDLTNNALCSLSTSVEAWADSSDPDWRQSQRCP